MADLRQQLRELLAGRVCLVGVGNVELGDDGFGVRLAERLAQRGTRSAERGMPKPEPEPWRFGLEPLPLSEGEDPHVGRAPAQPGTGDRWSLLIAGATPERHLPQLAAGDFDTVLFLDAVEVGAAPGSTALLNASEMAARFPQVSTHRISLGLLARLIEAEGRTKVWLLGVQPASLRDGTGLSAAVQTSLALLLPIFSELADARERREKGNSPLASCACFAANSAFRIPRSALPC